MKEPVAMKPPKNTTSESIVTPDGKIRPNNRAPYRKASNEEIERRVEFCYDLLVRGKTKTEIHKLMAKEFNINWSTVDSIYIPRSKKLRQDRAAISHGEMRDLVVTTLLDVVKTGSNGERIRASAELSEIFDLYAAKQFQVTTPRGEPMQTEEVGELPARLPKARMLEILAMIQAEGETNETNETEKIQEQENRNGH